MRLCRSALTLLMSLAITGCWFISSGQSQITEQIQYLDQGWTDTQRQRFYTLSQGSQFMPLAWFTALERPESEDSFARDDLSRFGYLPNRNSPDRLPVGFARDGGPWVGLTCATDAAMAMNVACRTADTGALVGSRQPPLGGHKLEKTDFVVNLASNIGIGVMEDWLLTKKSTPAVRATKSTTTVSEVLRSIPKPFRTAIATSGHCLALKVYKAGPLNGIWATAPYLHNGSVPSLYQLLLPSRQRLATFKTGSRKFDSTNVGFDSENGPFQFDTSVSGNTNVGHPYGTLLNDDERWDLVEYLKTL